MIPAFALWSVLAVVQESSTVTAVVREVPGDGARGLKPRIVCEGTADLPEGSPLDLRIYYGGTEPGRELQVRRVEVRKGAFTGEFFIFPEKNLAGSYSVRIGFPPGRRSQVLNFRVGSPRDGERDRARVLERLARDIRAMITLADEVEKTRLGSPGPPEAWRQYSAERCRQAWAFASRALTSPECRALRVEERLGAGLPTLCRRLQEIATVDREALRETRASFDTVAQKLLDRLAAEQIGGDTLGSWIEGMRGTLNGAARLTGDSLARSRKQFTAGLLRLQAAAPQRLHAEFVGLATAAVALFDESRSTEDRQSTFRRDVEPHLLRLTEEMKLSRRE